MGWLVYIALVTAQLNPGATDSPPGTGCEIGTSGCFPSSPPGPVTRPNDVGATSEVPPPVVDPKNVPYFGVLPGSPQSDQPIVRPDVQQQIDRQQQEERMQRMEERAQNLEQQLQDANDKLQD